MEGRGRLAGPEGEGRPEGLERLERLRRVLDGVGIGHGVGGAELLDVLWLARVMDGGRTGRAVRAALPGGEGAAGVAGGSGAVGGSGGSDASGAEGAVPPSAGRAGSVREEGTALSVPGPVPAMPEPGAGPKTEAGAGRRHSLFTAGDTAGTSSGGRARSVRAPGPRALPGMQGLARSMRPLRGYRDHRQRTVVDIDATVWLTAETGVLDVVSRPDRELRHTAVLLVDDSASMRVWRGLVLDVRRLLERGGVFRSVEVHRWNPRRPRAYGSAPRTESPVTLVLTDGVHPAWRTAAMGRAVAAWGRTGPVALLSPLPRRLWRGTAFDAQAQLLKAERPFGLSGDLAVLDPLSGGPVGPVGDGPEGAATSGAPAGVTDNAAGGTADRLPVPALALSPSSLASWARLLTRPGVPRLVDTVMLDVGAADEPGLLLPESLPEESGSGEVSPVGLIEQFRGSFSPGAYQLAVRLSAIRPLSMPVMQLVRTATLPGSSSAIVAEVLLGGLLQPLTYGGQRTAPLRLPPATRRGDTLYDFKPGVRELLATGLSMEQSIDVVEAVGRVLEPYLGRMPDFAALLADPAGRVALPEGASAFAALVSPAFDRLYGPPPSVSSPSSPSVVEVPSVPRAAPNAGPLRFTVLGPELAWRGDEPLRLSPRLRAVLTPLLLSGGRAVSVDRLTDAIWGDNTPPRRPEVALHANLSRLRREIRPEAAIVSVKGLGYRLDFTSDGSHVPLDLTLAKGYYEEARTARATDELSSAHAYLVEALALFQGEPLAAVPGPYAEIERRQLSEWRLQILEARCELDVRLGHYAEAVADLSSLTAQHPLREHFRSLLMLALYGSGRHADALAVYQDTRWLLADKVGLEPGPELAKVFREVRRQTPVETIGLDLLSRRGSAVSVPEQPSEQRKEGLRFSVLGPVRVWRDGTLLPSGSAQQRALLAALLLHPERTAAASQLIRAVWGDDPPAMALATVRTYVSRLLKILGRDVLIRERDSFSLRIEPDALDMGRAERLVDEAARAGRQDEPARVRELLDTAVALWDGEPLAGIPGPFAENQRNYLTNWRLELIEERLQLDLADGAHAEAVPELTALAAQHPLRERLRELLMLALYRSGRQAEALSAYADFVRLHTHDLLADELIADPSRRLSDLQQRILAGDPALSLSTAPEAVDADAAVAVPKQLPADIRDFTGRDTFVHELAYGLVSLARKSVTATSSVAGLGGVGKTALAVRIAHEVRGYFLDGQLYAGLQGNNSSPAEPTAVLGGFLRALGAADSQIPDSLAEREALYRSLLEHRRVLVLLDNARDTDQVLPLLPGSAGCAALVTSRRRMIGLPDAHLVNLDVLAPEEAIDLFASIVGERRAAAERKATLDVVAACGFLPLAIRIIASRLAARPTWTIKSVADALADERRRLNELQADGLAVRAVFEVGYQQLEPAQARAFRLVGLPDGPDISLAAAAAVLDLPLDETKDLLESLVDASQLESTAPGRYRHHDLVRLYARECAERDEQPFSERESAMSRLLDFYLVTAKAVYATDRPDDWLIEYLEPTAGLPFRNRREARDWFYDEARCLLAHVHRSTGRDTLRRAVDLLLASRDLAESGTYGQAYTAAAEAACEAARATSDTRAEVRARVCLSHAHVVAGRFEEADRQAEVAMAGSIVPYDPLSAGLVPDQQGIVALYRHRHADARGHFQQAIGVFRRNGDRSGEASAFCNLARAQLALGEAQSAIRSAEQGLDMLRGMRAGLSVGNALYALGMALTVQGHDKRATEAFTEAIDIFSRTRHPFWEGLARFRLAEAHLAAKRPARAVSSAERALGLLSEVGGEWRRANVLTVLGKGLAGIGQTARAHACWRDALAIYKALESPEAEEVTQLLATPLPRGLTQ